MDYSLEILNIIIWDSGSSQSSGECLFLLFSWQLPWLGSDCQFCVAFLGNSSNFSSVFKAFAMLLWVCLVPQSSGVSLGLVPFIHSIRGPHSSLKYSSHTLWLPGDPLLGPLARISFSRSFSCLCCHCIVPCNLGCLQGKVTGEKRENRITGFPSILFRPLGPFPQLLWPERWSSLGVLTACIISMEFCKWMCLQVRARKERKRRKRKRVGGFPPPTCFSAPFSWSSSHRTGFLLMFLPPSLLLLLFTFCSPQVVRCFLCDLNRVFVWISA